MTALSIVFGFRDRDVQRVERCLTSLEQQTFTDFEVLFVDYGSEPQTAQAVQKAVEQHSFAHYIYTETRGYPWNRSHALNIAGKQAQGEYILTNDVDMIFLPNFLEAMMEYANPQRELHISPYWLPEGFMDWENIATYQGHLDQIDKAGRGICLLSTAIFQEIRGYDEYYRYYGVEDRDMSQRLRLMGIEEQWIDDTTAIFHQWHPPANFEVHTVMPDTVWSRMQIHYQLHFNNIVRNDDNWGQIHTNEQRPVFQFIDADTQSLIEQESLHFLDLEPYKNASITQLSDFIHNLPSKHACAVNNAFFPQRSEQANQVFKMTAKVFRFLRLDITPPDYGQNRLHNHLVDLIDVSRLFADYYLNLPVMNGVSIVVKG